MKKMRILLIAAVLIALLIPTTVLAAGTFYCSALISSGGSGTYANPWACSSDAQLNTIIYDYICNRYNGGYLYRIFSGSYVLYRIDYAASAQCTVTGTEYPGYPPDTGPELPISLVLASAGAVGAILLVAGLTLRRKQNPS
jgi:hypothetical protein